MENFINKSALVDALGISTRTLENWCVHRNFPKARRLSGSRLVFFCIAEVDAWLELALEAGAAE
jgi:predicted DNA-binding transcriptional regulator AlpA